ncbi:hypothetical protein HQ621_27995 [Pseudomonas simiae]|uniref:hypothetical protein n=1 Tax=Pseudomonas simiae TaxID=321846 RepID=UPI00116388DF|nr:hypothetical protein [Pseudomonas simiae]AXH68358.1 hypothetical protein P021_gp49 [Pelagibacter phage HTVC021P]NVH64757.1 hypothetical protein [Pseudomonas simiae]
MKHKAIYELYPNVKSILNDKAFDENGNEVSIDMSAVDTKTTELENQAEADKQANIDLKASAKAKLVAGEKLTEEEANTIVL